MMFFFGAGFVVALIIVTVPVLLFGDYMSKKYGWKEWFDR